MRPPAPDLPPTLASLADALSSGALTSVSLVDRLLAAIRADDSLGRQYRSLIAINPAAGEEAERLDGLRAGGACAGPLHGAPIVIKDNIETADAMATTAGSLALKNNVTGRDSPVVARLRAAGALVLAKANLSEWANFRSTHSMSGWSAMGGQCRNAIDPARSPCGSSSGSAVAVAAGFALAAVGTETDGSITTPAAVNGLVGLKPTVGLVSRTRIVPISESQDTAGPITRTVRDAAMLLAVMAGSDGADPATAQADARRSDYAAGLGAASLEGARLGIMRFAAGFHPATDAVFEAALQTMRMAGAVLVDIDEGNDRKAMRAAERLVLRTEFRAGVEAWLATTDPARVPARSVADLIAFNLEHAADEMPLFGQELFEAVHQIGGLDDAAYLEALDASRRLAREEGIDRLLALHGVEALIGPTLGPAFLIDPVLGDHYVGGDAIGLAAVAGYPHLTVPMGAVGALPVGLSLLGPAWSEARLLALGHAFEQLAAS